MNKTIDIQAPLQAHQEIVINAPLDKVWQLQTAIANWPTWQPDISAAKLEGPLKAGAVFRWKAKGLKITSTLHTVEPERQIGWTGDSLGMFAIHNWTFAPQGKQTKVVSDESLSGWMARLLKLTDANFLDKSLAATLQTLKAAAEAK